MATDNYTMAINPSDSLFSGNFMLTLKKEVVENRKAILLGFGGIWGLCILIGGFLGYNTFGGTDGEVMGMSFIFLAIGCIAASMAYSNLKTKETRISTILLPDTPFDKFIIRWLAVVPVLFFIMLAGFYLCEFSRILVFKLSYDSEIVGRSAAYCRVLNPWAVIGMNGFPGGERLRALVLASYFFSQSFYFFGAVLWPKLSFVKTFAALWVLQTLGSIIIIFMNKWLVSFLLHADESILWWIFSVEIVITLALYYFAYVRYRNSQVVYKLF